MEQIKVMVVGCNDEKILELKNIIQKSDLVFVGFAKQGDTALEKVLGLMPNVILLQCDKDYDVFCNLAEDIYIRMPGSSVIMLINDVDLDVINKAMLVGVRKVLKFPIERDELIDHIRISYSIEKNRVVNANHSLQSRESKVITVFGSKGGIGKTTIAVNLAVWLAKTGKKVAIIDADLQFGDANVFFDIDSKETISELVEHSSELNIDIINRFMMLHYSGVSILCAPTSPEYAEYVTAKQVELIINTVRPHFDYIIIDTTPIFNDTMIMALENSDLILLVAGMDISTIRNTKTTLNILDALKQKEKVEMVLNRVIEGGIKPKEIEAILQMPIRNRISFDFKTALNSHNKGVPIVIDAPGSAIASEIYQCAKNVLDAIYRK